MSTTNPRAHCRHGACAAEQRTGMHRRVAATCSEREVRPRASPTPDDARSWQTEATHNHVVLHQRAIITAAGRFAFGGKCSWRPKSASRVTSPTPGWDPYKMSDASRRVASQATRPSAARWLQMFPACRTLLYIAEAGSSSVLSSCT